MPDNQLDTEKALLLQVSKGDEKAFQQLYRKYSSLLYSFLYEHTDSPDLADDLVQDIFTQIWLTRETLTVINRFGSYLFVIARNYALNEIKRTIREKARKRSWLETQTQNDDAEFDQTWQKQLNIVERAIENLPEQQQRVWILSRRNGLKHIDIAEQMNISRETVKKYIQYANTSIMKFVEQHLDFLVIMLISKIS